MKTKKQNWIKEVWGKAKRLIMRFLSWLVPYKELSVLQVMIIAGINWKHSAR